MARAPSKVLSAADKKADAALNKERIKGAKQVLKEADAAVRAHMKEVVATSKAQDKAFKALTKDHAAAQKAYDKLVPADAAA